MLQRLYVLRIEVAKFLLDKDEMIPELNDSKWLSYLAFLVDITHHLNGLNLLLQGRDQLVNSLLDHICAFKVKLRLYGTHLQQNNLYHFPAVAEQQNVDTSAYVALLTICIPSLSNGFRKLTLTGKTLVISPLHLTLT